MGKMIQKLKQNWVIIVNSILLIVIIFLTGYYSSISKMDPLNVNDEKFAQDFTDLEKRVNEQQLARQPYFGDYIEINPASLAYNADNVINVTGFDPRNVLQVGDKIRLTQGGNTKYFYVVLLSATQITLNAGSDYTYTNSALTLFGYSRVTNPTGHPLSFAYSPTVRDDTTNNVIATTTLNVRYVMNGNVITIFYNIQNTTGVAPALLGINFTTPFVTRAATPDLNFNSQLGRCVFVSTQSVSQALFLRATNNGSVNIRGISNTVANTIFVFDGKIDYIY